MIMKKRYTLIFLAVICLIISSCGPSQEEIKRREQAVADSIAHVYEQKQLKEEEERRRKKEMEEEEIRRQEEYNNRPEVMREKLLNKENSNHLDYLSARFN
jgi:predicted Holliday junction resolvase-like endonuclease